MAAFNINSLPSLRHIFCCCNVCGFCVRKHLHNADGKSFYLPRFSPRRIRVVMHWLTPLNHNPLPDKSLQAKHDAAARHPHFKKTNNNKHTATLKDKQQIHSNFKRPTIKKTNKNKMRSNFKVR